MSVAHPPLMQPARAPAPSPEADLALARVLQAVRDLRAAESWVRRSAMDFWSDEPTVRFWGQCVNAEEALLTFAAHILKEPPSLACDTAQLALF